ncbi:MAG: L-2-hydroxyglutarate oxidase [Bacteroidota bacterium]|nr:L-2-hydroxyglutarate oxidase [Bacteroidota bacterium]
MKEEVFDIAIVGGGIVGSATFYQLQKSLPTKKLVLIEKESKLAHHQTGNNSGVIHSGLYYTPGSKKAENCVNGRHELVKFAKDHRINHDICGKVVVATSSSEISNLEKILDNGIQNNIEGIERINADQIKEIEPEVAGVDGIWVPCTGIIDFASVTERMIQVAIGTNTSSKVYTSTEVVNIEQGEYEKVILCKNLKIKSTFLIVCGGLQADRLAKIDQVNLKEKVVGFRGDYYELEEHAKHKVKNLIYPVPDPQFPFLGVHFTRMVNGDVECGPNAVFSFKREGYGKTDFSLKDTVDALTYSGTWRLFLKNASYGINEYRRAFSKTLFLKTLQKLIPSLEMKDIKTGRAGVRALLLGKDGDTRDDFRIEYGNNSIHVLNAPSPAATAAMAIGNDIKKMAIERFNVN